jgi:outer membrane protein insertion porin family
LRSLRVFCCAILLLGASLHLGGARAQAVSGGDEIRQFRVEGIQRIEKATVLTYLAVRIGDPFDPERIDRSLKNLFATGLFADVSLRREGWALIIRVVENPIINRIAFEGNTFIEDDGLVAEIRLRPRVVYTRSKVQTDVKRILDLYRKSGRFAATVDPKIIMLEQNRVDLVFEIDEGAPTRVRTIRFIGNKRFSDDRLRSTISTKEEAWYRFFTSADTYDPDRLTFDRELLRRYYLSKGYADFRVISAVAELTPDRQDFFVTFTVDEGARYRFGKIKIVNKLRGVDVDSLYPLLITEQGEWYDAGQIDKSVDALTEALGRQGFAFVDTRPRVRRQRKGQIVEVLFDIQEGPRVFVQRIDIKGNTRTLDKVIRREMRLSEGDAFNSAKLRRSRQRIRNLGFFRRVEVSNAPSAAPDKTVINVEVEEQSTGELSFGVGFATTQGGLLNVSLKERNLLGRGQDVRTSFTLSQRQQQFDFSFTEPYFLNRELIGGIDLFRTTTDFQSESSFDRQATGGALRTGYALGEHLRQTWRYLLSFDEIRNVSIFASPVVRQNKGGRLSSAISTDLTYDVRDSRNDPTQGYFTTLSIDFAGLGGNVNFLRNEVRGAYYYSIVEDVVASLAGEAGIIFGAFGDDVRIFDRFFRGGNTFRGFQVSGVGPRDPLTRDSLGGTKYYTSTAEVTFPVGLPEELGVKGAVFGIVGSLFDPGKNTVNIQDSSAPRVSTGAGIAWRSPFGPVRLDFSIPLVKESFDRTEVVQFNFGTRF